MHPTTRVTHCFHPWMHLVCGSYSNYKIPVYMHLCVLHACLCPYKCIYVCIGCVPGLLMCLFVSMEVARVRVWKFTYLGEISNSFKFISLSHCCFLTEQLNYLRKLKIACFVILTRNFFTEEIKIPPKITYFFTLKSPHPITTLDLIFDLNLNQTFLSLASSSPFFLM